MTTRLMGRLEEVHRLSSAQLDRLFELMNTHFERISLDSFRRDLSEKRWVILLSERESGQIEGFSTLMPIEQLLDGVAVRVLFSGDTIIDRRYWGETELGRVWIQKLVAQSEREPRLPTYWFLTSMGHRTYRVLPLFFKRYHPQEGRSSPAFEQRLVDVLGAQKFGSSYDPATGLIRFDPPRECLRPEIGRVPESMRDNPAVRYFLARNPGHHRGDELACLAEVRRDNLTSFALKLLGRLDGAAPRPDAVASGDTAAGTEPEPRDARSR
jgi:hypothetical protein